MDKAARLEWIRDRRYVGSARQMSLKCGLAHSHVSTLIRRLKNDPASSVEESTLRKIARCSGVRVAWLIDGEEPATVEGDASWSPCDSDRYPARADAERAARALRTIREEAITRVRKYDYPESASASRISSEDWLMKMIEAERDIRRVEADAASSESMCGRS